MTEVRIGDRVTFKARAFVVSGVSPMSVTSRVVHLVDAETGERLDVPAEELEPDRRDDAAA